jgi:hypothetical protein
MAVTLYRQVEKGKARRYKKVNFGTPRIVNYSIFLEDRYAAIPQGDITEFSSKRPCQCRGERAVMRCRISD